MDWRLVASTFVVIFLAELGDKTQLAVLFGSSSTGKFWEIFLGASLALILSTLIAAILGDQLAAHLPERIVKVASGIAFIGIGMFLLIKG